MVRRRVLFLSQDMPWPPRSGGVIRTHRMLTGLARRFELTLLAGGAQRVSAGEGRRALGELGCAVELVPDVKRPGRVGVAWSAARSLVGGESMVLRHNHNPHLARAVLARLGAFEGVQLNQLDTVEYLGAGGGPAAVLDTQNVLHQYYARRAEHEANPLARLACRREARLLEAYELAAARRVARTVVCSAPERESLLALDPELRVEVVPNGVDLWPPPAVAPEPSGAGYDLAFVGDMRYGPNVDGALYFALEVLPLVRAREPRARFLIVGHSPPPKVVALAGEGAGIVVTGFVEDVREPVLRARAAVVPLRYGSGTRLKVLEAFALGTPLVSTSLGAEGIEAEHERHLLLADQPEALAAAVLRLFDEPDLGPRLARAARELVEAHYAWPALADRMADVLQVAIEERVGR